MTNSKQNILLIGDLTTANNYGAIATSEALKKMLNEKYDGSNIKYIDYRSFHVPTPINGWGVWSEKSKSSKIYGVVRNIDHSGLILKSVLYILGKKLKAENRRDIPYLFKNYEIFAQKVLNNEVLQYEYKLLKWADVIYINGEGNVVNGTDKEGVYRIGALYLFFLAYFAKKHLNKYCAIVNHTVDPNNSDAIEIIMNLYPQLDDITVREPCSQHLLREIGIDNVRLVPDALFTYVPVETEWIPTSTLKQEIDFTKPYICIGDSSAIRSRTKEIKWDVYQVYSKMITRLKQIVPQIVFIDGFNGQHEGINKIVKVHGLGRVNLKNCDYNELYHVLSKSEVFVSGRWHASILSLLSGTPVILWSADSHKTKGLHILLDYPHKFFDIDSLPLHIEDIAEEIELILENKEELRSTLRNQIQKIKMNMQL